MQTGARYAPPRPHGAIAAIVDLVGAEQIAAPHIAEALRYRPQVEVG